MKQTIRLDRGVRTLHEITAADKKYIENLYESVKKDIRKKMTELGIRNNPKTAVSDSLKKFQLRELEKSIDRDLEEIRLSTQEHIIGSMTAVSQAVAQSNADWLASLGLNFSFSVASVPPDVVANLVSGKVYANNWQFSKRIWGDYRSSKGDVSNIVARGIAENKSAYEIAKDLEKYVSPSAAKPWDWSKVYPGCKKKIDYNAQRLARTLSAPAYQQSVIETAKRNPFTTRVEWHSAMVERTCPICEARNGQIYELGKVPMDHPNGLCCIYPVLDKSLEDISNILADWVNGEGDADMNGKIDKYISYLGYDPGKVAADTLKAGSMLKGLDKIAESGIIKLSDTNNSNIESIIITQEAIDRVAKLDVFDDEAINIAIQNQSRRILHDMTSHQPGTEETISMALDDLASSFFNIGDEGAHSVEAIVLHKPYISIHNHPTGKTFSELDINKFFKDPNMEAMCVVGNDGSMYIVIKRSEYNWMTFGPIKDNFSNDIHGLMENQNGKQIDYFEK